MGHKNTKKHKAQHGNYFQKPGKKQVSALMDLYAGIQESAPKSGQLKLEL